MCSPEREFSKSAMSSPGEGESRAYLIRANVYVIRCEKTPMREFC